jgi:hypothetical protein
MGALHPILFFIVVYVVALFFSIFICSSLFYSCKSNTTVAKGQKMPAPKQETTGTIATVVIH